MNFVKRKIPQNFICYLLFGFGYLSSTAQDQSLVDFKPKAIQFSTPNVDSINLNGINKRKIEIEVLVHAPEVSQKTLLKWLKKGSYAIQLTQIQDTMLVVNLPNLDRTKDNEAALDKIHIIVHAPGYYIIQNYKLFKNPQLEDHIVVRKSELREKILSKARTMTETINTKLTLSNSLEDANNPKQRKVKLEDSIYRTITLNGQVLKGE